MDNRHEDQTDGSLKTSRHVDVFEIISKAIERMLEDRANRASMSQRASKNADCRYYLHLLVGNHLRKWLENGKWVNVSSNFRHQSATAQNMQYSTEKIVPVTLRKYLWM